MTNRVAGRLAAVGFVALSMALAATPARAEAIPNQYICVFKNDRVAKSEAGDRANAAARAHGGSVRRVFKNTIRGFAANMSEQAVTAMRRSNASIAYCEQDQVASIDPGQAQARPGGGGGTTSPQATPYGITRVNGGAPYTGTRKAYIIDTGIDPTHPDLNVYTAEAANFSRETTFVDNNGHGSHVAGTIAAIDNAFGVIGVAPGARVVPVKTLDRRGSGSCSDITAGVDYVAGVANPGDVANMSVGCPGLVSLDNAVLAAGQAGVVMLLAAGNESKDIGTVSPARAGAVSANDNVYTISAIDSANRFASFSNFGAGVAFAEPGVGVLSTYKSGGYATLSGTSMATPHAAGLFLLGTPRTDGTAIGDPSAPADPIGVR